MPETTPVPPGAGDVIRICEYASRILTENTDTFVASFDARLAAASLAEQILGTISGDDERTADAAAMVAKVAADHRRSSE